MSKAANFSFVAELPTYRTARHCCGLAKVTTLYFILTSLVTLQFVFLVVSSAPLDDNSGTNLLGLLLNIKDKSLVLFGILAAVFSVWVVLAIISFAGLIKRNPYFHLPLLTLEFLVSFCLLSSAGVAIFLYQIFNSADKTTSKNGPNPTDFLHRALFLLVLFICHAYYCYVIFSLFGDVKAKKETEAFIARQKMLDEVCEEMIWEEEEAEKYHGNTSLTMSGVYYQESICYSNGSIASRELSTYYLDADRSYHHHNQYQHQQPQRFVTFYDEDEDSY